MIKYGGIERGDSMLNDIIDFKYLDEIKDKTMRYIFTTIMNNSSYTETSTRLSKELGISKDEILNKYYTAARMINNKIESDREKEFNKKLEMCYGNDKFLSLEKIAKQERVTVDELRKIFSEYVDSLTEEELCTSHKYAFSLERLKVDNIKVLNTSVNGFGDFKPYYIHSQQHKNEEVEFIKSIPTICEEYYLNKAKARKVYMKG